MGILLFTALIGTLGSMSSCTSKKNIKLVTEVESEKLALATVNSDATINNDSALPEELSVNYAINSNNNSEEIQSFQSMIIATNEMNVDGKLVPVQYITLQNDQASVVLTARHTLAAGRENGTHVFVNHYLPFGYFEAEKSFFGIPVKNESDLQELKSNLLNSNNLKDGVAVVILSTVETHDVISDTGEASYKLETPQTRVRLLELDSKKVNALTFEAAVASHGQSFANNNNEQILVNLFQLGKVTDSFLPVGSKAVNDFDAKDVIFETELTPSPEVEIE